MPRVAVIGCGAVGLLVSVALASQGLVTTLYCMRDQDVVEILRDDGVIRVTGRGEASAKVSAAHISFMRKGYDGVIYASRLNDLEKVATFVTRILGRNTEHIFLQPSIYVLRVAKSSGLDPEFLALYTCVRRIGPSIAEWVGLGQVEVSGSGEICEYIVNGLKSLGLTVSENKRLEDAVWNYFAANLAVQPVSTIIGIPVSRIKQNKYARGIVEQLWREAELVARENNISLRTGALETLLSLRGCVPRMLQDIEARIRTEIDYINGVLLREALEKRLLVPYNDSVYMIVKALEESMVGS
ncbi:2-dehydropantoate 2-reductase [Pyrofollis japonicus]|uniref:ketopantoate reductase family protein n=1 Tax=Pyrofollis japonicus TaxID=3060460 RepID=UPI00295B1751|nr:ketopantoate reductase C-terminal domain-containing protein [Pyrofollis japonicus]BEP18602.1 2-dehydropantoate 2-reductase [Pyrofollis japonicus]